MFAERVLSYFANQIVAVSENLKEDITRYEGISSERIKVITNGINGNKYNNKIDKNKKRRELGIDNKHNIILGFVGRLSSEKGLIYLIKAMEPLVKEFQNLLLLIAGEGGLLEGLKREAIALGVEQNIRFLGPRSDINEILSILDIFILPSLREGLPLVLLEAAATSLPILATDVGGNKQVVKHGANGLLVKHGDVASLYNSIKELITNEGMRKEFGSKSYDLFTNNFTIKKMIKEYETIYQDCIK
jgi:glycosyltransferase involved in cell wall biosynthesis